MTIIHFLHLLSLLLLLQSSPHNTGNSILLVWGQIQNSSIFGLLHTLSAICFFMKKETFNSCNGLDFFPLEHISVLVTPLRSNSVQVEENSKR